MSLREALRRLEPSGFVLALAIAQAGLVLLGNSLTRRFGLPAAVASALVLSAFALGWLWQTRQPAGTAESRPARAIARLLGIAVPLVALLSVLTRQRDIVGPSLTRGLALDAGTAVNGLGLLALLGIAFACFRAPPARVWIPAAALWGAAFRLASYELVPMDPNTADMLPLVAKALDNLAAGTSPYATYHMPWELPLTYLPLTWLAYWPCDALGVDIRVTNLIAELAIGAVLARWLSARAGSAPARPWYDEPMLLVWAAVFVSPKMATWSLETSAPIGWALLGGLIALFDRGRLLPAAVVLGLLTAASPFAAVVGPLALIHTFNIGGLREAVRVAGVAACVAAAFVLPFYLWAPDDFVFGTLRWFNDNELFPRAAWLRDRIWEQQVGFSGLFWRADSPGLLKPIQLAALAGICVYQLRSRARRLAHLIAAAFLAFMLFNPVLWPYLLVPAVIASLFTSSGGSGSALQVRDNAVVLRSV